MNQFRRMRGTLPIISAITFCLTLSIPTFSHANTIYHAITLVDVSITGFSSHSRRLVSKPHDVFIAGNASVIAQESMITGNAFADQFADAAVIGQNMNDLSVGNGLSQQAIVTGEALMGTALSLAFTQGILSINNFSQTESYTIDFEADWSYLVDANATHTNVQFATAVSEIFLESDRDHSVLDLTVSADSDFMSGLLTDNGTQPFSIYLLPGESDVLNLTVNAAGVATATAPVPEPSTLVLFGLGLLGTVFMRWRTQQWKAGHLTQGFLNDAHHSSSRPRYATDNYSHFQEVLT
ncbi:MAG: hypothetical protein NPIRA05_10870 [Nitrospirales bacterium]|nr:MAG: hypothetical protein NPIRA05_10870 [Nitrospirales bacterium]